MATESAAKSVHNTLSGTTADAITITGYDTVDIINRHSSELLYFRSDGTTAVAAADAPQKQTDVLDSGDRSL